MTFMFVANASIQIHEFIYRIPEQKKERRITIQPMSQQRLPDDMGPDDIAAVVSQHEIYGFISVQDVKNGSTRKKTTRLCYNVGASVPAHVIEAVFRQNINVMDEDGRKQRELSAIRSNTAVVNALEEQKRQGLEADVKNFEITVQEEEPRGGYDRPDSEVIAEGYRVDSSATQQSAGVKFKGRRK